MTGANPQGEPTPGAAVPTEPAPAGVAPSPPVPTEPAPAGVAGEPGAPAGSTEPQGGQEGAPAAQPSPPSGETVEQIVRQRAALQRNLQRIHDYLKENAPDELAAYNATRSGPDPSARSTESNQPGVAAAPEPAKFDPGTEDDAVNKGMAALYGQIKSDREAEREAERQEREKERQEREISSRQHEWKGQMAQTRQALANLQAVDPETNQPAIPKEVYDYAVTQAFEHMELPEGQNRLNLPGGPYRFLKLVTELIEGRMARTGLDALTTRNNNDAATKIDAAKAVITPEGGAIPAASTQSEEAQATQRRLDAFRGNKQSAGKLMRQAFANVPAQ